MFSEFLLGLQNKEEEETQDGAGNAPKKGAKFSLMDVASSVVSSMKDDVDDLVTSFRSTNWTNELLNFGKTMQDETTEAVKSLEHLTENENVKSVRQQLGTGIRKLAVGTKDLFDQAVGTIESELGNRGAGKADSTDAPSSGIKHTRLELEVMSMQRDSNTYCDPPTDAEDFAKWKTSFRLEDKEEEINQLLLDNAFMTELHKHIVPEIVQHEIFWTNYFYRLHKLRERHDQRQQLAERTLRMHEEEEQELQWDDPIEQEVSSPSALAADPAAKPPSTEVSADVVDQVASTEQQEEKRAASTEEEATDWTLVEALPVDTHDVPSNAPQSPRPESPRRTQAQHASSSRLDEQPTAANAPNHSKQDSEEEVDEDWGDWD